MYGFVIDRLILESVKEDRSSFVSAELDVYAFLFQYLEGNVRALVVHAGFIFFTIGTHSPDCGSILTVIIRHKIFRLIEFGFDLGSLFFGQFIALVVRHAAQDVFDGVEFFAVFFHSYFVERAFERRFVRFGLVSKVFKLLFGEIVEDRFPNVGIVARRQIVRSNMIVRDEFRIFLLLLGKERLRRLFDVCQGHILESLCQFFRRGRLLF